MLETDQAWPENVAEIYQEIAEEDRQLAEAMFKEARATWPSPLQGA